ncbi:MAG: YbbR-like domain-containing protein [Planctomycetota bacterium]|jgi:hypothetical protein
MKWLRAHWEIKLISLALAVVVYFFAGSVLRVEREVRVQLAAQHVAGLPPDYRIRSLVPSEFKVVVDGPKNAMWRFDEGSVVPRLLVTPEALIDGEAGFDVTDALLQLPSELRLRQTPIDRVHLAVERVETAVVLLNVTTADFTVLDPGLVVRQVVAENRYVTVRGPAGAIAQLQAGVGVVPVVLRDLSVEQAESTEQVVAIKPDLAAGLNLVGIQEIAATVTVAPVPVERPVALPVRVLASAEALRRYDVELDQREVVVVVRGPSSRIASLMAERDLVAYVDVGEEPTLDVPQSYPVRVLTPRWLSVVGRVQARAVVRLRDADAVVPVVVPDDQMGVWPMATP